MKVTIHQPEHFPYLGFFQKMNKADIIVILDNVNFRKNYFQNRNRFKNSQGVEEWFTIPVPKDAVKKQIKDVKPSETNWRTKILKKLSYNFKLDLTHVYETELLADINIRSIVYCAGRLGVDTPIIRAATLSAEGSKSELLGNICKELNAKEYISGPSGRDYLDLSYFEGIDVSFFEPNVPNLYTTLANL
jgi:hypothetical protein